MRVLIVDDHPVPREAIRALLELSLTPEVECVGEALDGEGAVVKARDMQPDVVIMDVGLPGINGFEATRLIKEEMPEVAVVIVTALDEYPYRDEAFRSGAADFLTKDKMDSDLLPLLRGLSGG